MTKISVVINTLNEEKSLPRALDSVRSLADEIVVVDMKSADRTVEVAKKHGAKVYEHERTGYVEPARNFAIGKATGDWILILDADEEVPEKLVNILRVIADEEETTEAIASYHGGDKNAEPPEEFNADYYRIPRKNIIFGKWIKYSRWWPDHNIRFFKKGFVEWSEIIHSVPTTKGKGWDWEAREEYAIIHYHYKDVDQFITRMNRYTTEHAKLLVKNGYSFDWKDLIVKPVDEFLSRYFRGQGYKDGLHGLALSGLQAFSEFVMYLKTWQIEGMKEQDIDLGEVIKKMKQKGSDVNYWHADTLIKEGAGIKERLRRKLKI